jgi:hypothetical protein
MDNCIHFQHKINLKRPNKYDVPAGPPPASCNLKLILYILH